MLDSVGGHTIHFQPVEPRENLHLPARYIRASSHPDRYQSHNNWFGGVVGYHACLTSKDAGHKRSPDRARAESLNFCYFFFVVFDMLCYLGSFLDFALAFFTPFLRINAEIDHPTWLPRL